MTQPVYVLPIAGMARVLAEHRPEDRATPEAAALILMRERLFVRDDIAAGLTEAMRLADSMLSAAASDAPWAVGLGYLRDLAAATVLIVGGMYAWGVVA